MNKPSFLLCLNGSRKAQVAAELAFEMARKSDAQITAQHVVDTVSSWELLRNDEAGLIGSGLYVETFELLKEAQWVIASKLLEKYEALVESRKVDSVSVIDEGDTVEQICQRAKEHDLVIAGNGNDSISRFRHRRWHQLHYNVAQGLASQCPKPLLITQNFGPSFWHDMKILVSPEHLNISFVRACLRTAVFFGLKPTIVCLLSGYHEERKKDLVKNLHKTHPDLKEIDIEVQVVRPAQQVNQDHVELWSNEPIEIEFDYSRYNNSLLVLPTRAISGKRISILGVEAEEIVSQLAIPSILLWPEESIHSRNSEDRNFEKLTA